MKLFLLVSTALAKNPAQSSYDFEESDSYDGRFWTQWSDFYGCPSNRYHPFTQTGEGVEGYKRYCTTTNNDQARAVRFKECTLPDGVNYGGDSNGYADSQALSRTYQNERLVSKDGAAIGIGADLADWSATIPPTGDGDEILDPRQTMNYGREIWPENGDFGNYYGVQGRGNVRIKNERYACDPRLRRAAQDCLKAADICGFDFDAIQNYAETNIETFDESALDATTREKMIDKLVLMIEDEIEKGTLSWTSAIPSPYQRSKEEYNLCREDCPIPMEWSEWSCHCEKASALNGNSSYNPAGLPLCDCAQEKRHRVQTCFGSRTVQDGADTVELECNIYHDADYVRPQQQLLCDNYGYAHGAFLGPEKDATLDTSYAGLTTLSEKFIKNGDTLADGTVFNIGTMFKQYLGDNSFFKFLKLDANDMKEYCQSDETYPPFSHELTADSTDYYAVQYDECRIETRWSSWSNFGECSVTCGGGTQSRTRNCEQKVNGEWIVNNDLIGQDCACQDGGETSNECNTQCCPVWQACDPDTGGDCTSNADYQVGSSLKFKDCEKDCGDESVKAYMKCMCKNDDDTFEYGDGVAECGVIDDCNVTGNKCETAGTGQDMREVATKNCGHKCCTMWTEWSFNCDNSCVNCFSADRTRKADATRDCKCVDDTYTEGSDSLGVSECGALDKTKQQVCDLTGENVQCCPQWGPWSPFSACDNCILPQWNENDLCCDIHPEATARRTRDRECFRAEYSTDQLVMDQALVDLDSTKKLSNTQCTDGDAQQKADCEKPTETDDLASYTGSKWCCEVAEPWLPWQPCKNEDLEMFSYNGVPDSCAKSASGKRHWGLQTSSRNHLCMEPHDDKRENPSKEPDCPACLKSQPCQIDACPQWAPWAEWGGCPCDCGGDAKHKRTRQCYGLNNQGYIDDDNEFCGNCGNVDEETCNGGSCAKLQFCNDDEFYSTPAWTEWSTCSVSCGAGKESRHVKCERDGVAVDLDNCNLIPWEYKDELSIYMMERKDLVEERDCFDAVCPPEPFWTEWSECDTLCRQENEPIAVKHRRRVCPEGAIDCEETFEKGFCATEFCAVESNAEWLSWSEWSPCTVPCGSSGLSYRFRWCTDPNAVGPDGACSGATMETKECETIPTECPGEWSDWGECKTLEGETDLAAKGIKSRTNGVETEQAPCSCIVSDEKVTTEEDTVFGTIDVTIIPKEATLNTILSDGSENEEITMAKLIDTMRTDPNYKENEMFKSALATITQLLKDQGKIDDDDVVTLELIDQPRQRRQAEDTSKVISINISKNVDGEKGTEEQVTANTLDSLTGVFNETEAVKAEPELFVGKIPEADPTEASTEVPTVSTNTTEPTTSSTKVDTTKSIEATTKSTTEASKSSSTSAADPESNAIFHSISVALFVTMILLT